MFQFAQRRKLFFLISACVIIPGLIAMLGYLVAIAVYVRLVPGHAPEKVEVERIDGRTLGPGIVARDLVESDCGHGNSFHGQERARRSE